MDPLRRKTLNVAIDLVDHPKFKWKCGMKTGCGKRIKSGWTMDKWLKSFEKDEAPIPDLDDPATQGCLLFLVRELSRDDSAYAAKFDEGWCVVVWPEPSEIKYYESEGLALADYIIQQSRFF